MTCGSTAPATATRDPACPSETGVCGDRHYQCARDWAGPLYYTRNDEPIPEGTHTVHARAVDAVDNAKDSPAWTIKIDRSAPTVTPSGDLYDQRDQYLDGQGIRSLTVEGSDALSGIASLEVEDVGRGTIARRDISCSSNQCPLRTIQPLAVGLTALSEGRRTLRAVAKDMVGNVQPSTTWTVFVDRTAPPPPTNVRAVYDDVEGSTYLVWDPSADPSLPDGFTWQWPGL